MQRLGLGNRFARALADPELTELRHEIAVVDVEIDTMLIDMRAATGGDPPSQRQALFAAIEQRRKLVDSVHKNAAATVPVERVVAFLHAITNLVLEIVTDRKQKMVFLERLRLMTGRESTVTVEPAR